MLFLGMNPVVNGVHSLSFRFEKHPLLTLPNGFWLAKGVRIKFEIRGGWFAQKVEIDASSGLYDWIRRTVRLTAKPGKIAFKDVTFGIGGTPISFPPDLNLDNPKTLVDGEISIWILDVGGLDVPKDIPALDKFVFDEDLEMVRSGIPRAAYRS